MDFKDRQREAMRLAARIESKAAEANSEAKSAGGKEWEANSEAKSAGGKEREPEFLFFYRCHTPLFQHLKQNTVKVSFGAGRRIFWPMLIETDRWIEKIENLFIEIL